MYAIASAVIGGCSLQEGGIGTIWGTIIGVFIMSVLSTGLPSMDLQAHYQTFFTGVIVIGAVLLDMYRNRKASEVRIGTAADAYRDSMMDRIAALKKELSSRKGETDQAAALKKEIAAARAGMKSAYARMKGEEKAEAARLRAEEKAADREFSEMLRRKELLRQDGAKGKP
jgi:ribose transport system permease protein